VASVIVSRDKIVLFQSIRWRIAVSYVVLILLAMVGLAVYLSALMRDAHLDDLEAQLTVEAQVIGDVLATSPAWEQTGGDLDLLARHYADLLDARVTLIAADGVVLGESHEDRTEMDNHLYRPEVQQALSEGQGSGIRFSRTVGYEMMYVAVPVAAGDRVVGIARVALPLRQIEANVARLRWAVVGAALLTALGATLLALVIAERTARPVRRLTEVVQRMAEGDLSARLLPMTYPDRGTGAAGRCAGQHGRRGDHHRRRRARPPHQSCRGPAPRHRRRGGLGPSLRPSGARSPAHRTVAAMLRAR
jgi:two-component system phosphate regulon sensor histidine kinase PhoR